MILQEKKYKKKPFENQMWILHSVRIETQTNVLQGDRHKDHTRYIKELARSWVEQGPSRDDPTLTISTEDRVPQTTMDVANLEHIESIPKLNVHK
jgi:hypothetical protein